MGISNRSKLTCVVPLLCAALIALAPQVASASSDEANAEKNFSPATLTFLQAKTGMDAEQWNNVMRLVNKSEQDDPSFSGWVK